MQMDGKPYCAGVKVIGTGLGRTGTSSLKKALEILYPEAPACYHMTEVIKGGGPFGHFDFWTGAEAGKRTVEDFRSHLQGFAATCDYPSCLFWKQQLEAYPDALVVHSTRSADSWVTSVLETIFMFQPGNPARPYGVRLLQTLLPLKVGIPMRRMLVALIEKQTGGDYSRENLKKVFLDWEQHIKAEVPSHKLLIHEAKDGWEPLCKHLGLPVPTVPYPNLNDTKEMKKVIYGMAAAGWVVATLFGCCFWVFAAAAVA